MATAQAQDIQRFVLDGVSWADYLALLDWRRRTGRRFRITYDRGRMELMTVSFEHERSKYILGRLVEMLSFELDVDIMGAGSMTFKREAKQRGLEPDECYWFQHEPLMRGKTEYGPEVDPPHDLVIEVEVSRSLLDRVGILSGLGVPEVWCCRDGAIRVMLLGEDGRDEESLTSRTFPSLPMAELSRFVRLAAEIDERTLMKSFVAWVREEVLPAHRGAAGGPGPA